MIDPIALLKAVVEAYQTPAGTAAVATIITFGVIWYVGHKAVKWASRFIDQTRKDEDTASSKVEVMQARLEALHGERERDLLQRIQRAEVTIVQLQEDRQRDARQCDAKLDHMMTLLDAKSAQIAEMYGIMQEGGLVPTPTVRNERR